MVVIKHSFIRYLRYLVFNGFVDIKSLTIKSIGHSLKYLVNKYLELVIKD
jgi:hypothetical protein